MTMGGMTDMRTDALLHDPKTGSTHTPHIKETPGLSKGLSISV